MAPTGYVPSLSFNAISTQECSQIEYLTGCFFGKPSDCSPHQLWDFAFAGADITKAL